MHKQRAKRLLKRALLWEVCKQGVGGNQVCIAGPARSKQVCIADLCITTTTKANTNAHAVFHDEIARNIRINDCRFL